MLLKHVGARLVTDGRLCRRLESTGWWPERTPGQWNGMSCLRQKTTLRSQMEDIEFSR